MARIEAGGCEEAENLVGSRRFVTTYPCHYCDRHIVAADSKAIKLHRDAITAESLGWRPLSEGGTKVLFRPIYAYACYQRHRDLHRVAGSEATGTLADPAEGAALDGHRSKAGPTL